MLVKGAEYCSVRIFQIKYKINYSNFVPNQNTIFFPEEITQLENVLINGETKHEYLWFVQVWQKKTQLFFVVMKGENNLLSNLSKIVTYKRSHRILFTPHVTNNAYMYIHQMSSHYDKMKEEH